MWTQSQLEGQMSYCVYVLLAQVAWQYTLSDKNPTIMWRDLGNPLTWVKEKIISFINQYTP